MAVDLPRRSVGATPRRRINPPTAESVRNVSVAGDPGVRAPEGAFGGGFEGVGEALSGISGSIAQAAEKQQQRLDFTKTNEALLAYEKATTQEYQRRLTEADPAAPDFMSEFESFAQEQAEQALSNLPDDVSDEARERLNIKLQRKTVSWADSAGRKHIEAAQQQAFDVLEQRTGVFSAQARQYPNSVDSVIEDAKETVRGFAADLTPDQERDQIRAVQRTILTSAAEGMIDQGDFQGAKALLASDKYEDVFEPGERERLLEARRRAVANDVESLLGDHVASIQTTGQGLPGYEERAEAVLEGDALTDFRRQVDRARDFHDAMEIMRLAPPDEMVETLEGLRPEPGTEGFADRQDMFETARGAARDILQRRAEDPARYAMNDPEVQRAFEAAQRGERSLQSAVSLRLDAQRRMGVRNPAVLPVEEAKSMVNQLQDMPGQQRAAQLADMQERYGQHSQRVLQELSAEGLDPRSKVLASVAGDPALAQKLGQVIDTGSTELRDNLPPNMTGDVEEQVTTELTDFARAFSAGDFTGKSVPDMNAVHSLTTDLALLYARQSGDSTGAARRAASELINSRYETIRTAKVEAYVPKTLNGRALNVRNIEDAAEGRQNREKIAAFDPVPFGQVAEGLEFLNKERTIRTAASSGVWVTNQTGDALVLQVPLVDESGREVGTLPLVNQDGERYEVGFLEASTYERPMPEGVGDPDDLTRRRRGTARGGRRSLQNLDQDEFEDVGDDLRR